MRNVTLSADGGLVDRARRKAEAEKTTLNNLFREWLAKYAAERPLTVDELRQFVAPAAHFRVGRSLSRAERNER